MSNDDKNPTMMFQGIDKELLVKIIEGEINVKQLALKELQARGLNKYGEWCGY